MYAYHEQRIHHYRCVDSKQPFDSTSSKAQRCRPCAKERKRQMSLAHWRNNKRKQAGDDDTERAGVYSSLAYIRLDETYGRCAGCHGKRELINCYCATCRADGATEAQCMKAREITMKAR